MKKFLLVLFFHATAFAQSPGERMIADYFRNQTRRVAENALAQIRSLDDWKVTPHRGISTKEKTNDTHPSQSIS
jgi:hypothetical protein